MRPRLSRVRVGPARQRGAIVIAASMALLVCVALLASADIGYLFYIKREFQKSADLAALAGSQKLPNPCAAGSSASPTAAASANASANLSAHNFSAPPTVTVNCGVWSGAAAVAPAGSEGGRYFVAGGTPATINAVQVIITGDAPALMPFITTRAVRASAVATREQPSAVISTGSQLASLRLGGLNAAVLGSDGAARITLDGLLGRLGIPVSADIGVGELNALLAANKVSVGTLIAASASALPASGSALAAQLGVLRQTVEASATLSGAKVQLGGANSPVSLFTSIGSNVIQDSAALARAALHTELKVTDLISTAIGIAGVNNAVGIPSLNVAGMTVQAAIVSPPSVAAGPVGTTARQAQVRVSVDIDTDKIPLIGPLVAVLGVRVHLPLFLDVTRGTARINAISCTATPRTVDVLVNQSLLGACVGKVAPGVQFTSPGLCDAATPGDLQPEVLIKLLGANTLTTTMRFDALNATELMPGMQAGETRNSANNLPIGNTLSNILGTLAGTLSKLTSNAPPTGTTSAQVAQDTANLYLAQTPTTGGRYQIESLISLLQNGKPDGSLAALGTWNTNAKGDKFSVPYACGLGLGTCYADGSVWDSFRATVNGAGGALGSVLGTVLGGLVVNKCDSLLSGLGLVASYNTCVANNLVSYLQTKPGGVAQPPSSGPCTSLLCVTLAPITAAVTPLLNTIGSTLASALTSTLGLTLGQTSVTVQAISCGNVRLVY